MRVASLLFAALLPAAALAQSTPPSGSAQPAAPAGPPLGQFAAMDAESPLIEPEWRDDGTAQWQEIACESVTDALALMRTFIAANILARREDLTVFVPDQAPRPSA